MPLKKEIGQLSQRCDQVVRWQIQWTVGDIFSYRVADAWRISPRFSFQNSQWCICIYPNGETDENSVGWIGLYLWREDESRHRVRANLTFGIQRADGEVVKQKHGDLNGMFRDNLSYSGHPKFIDRSELHKRKLELAPLDSLTLTCTLVVEDGSLANSMQEALSENLTDLFISKRSCDTTLKVHHEQFPVHKLILGARSPVFAAMFEADMKEKDTGVVDIEDCDPEAFRDFLTYLYSGKFESNSGRVFELYRIADKYCVVGLKAACVIDMMNHLSAENVCETAVLADEFGETELQEMTQVYFNNHFSRVISTTNWESLLAANRILANELLKNMASDKGL